ncbi:Vacuolar protein sorting-associated protein 29 [Ceratobasidium sp. 428]|nr:Vacuolar protein sorting-associated protein 29 [Ceratobasidium sp. 395]KAG8772324.1 Vacuolar protein sorting-associated protein 29 [Ceratobasidium sp. 428]
MAYPMSLTLRHPPLTLGVVHGHQCVPAGDIDALHGIARQLDVDILVSGHTHKFSAIEHQGVFFVNPGSATGAWSGASAALDNGQSPTPSFLLLDIQGPAVVTYVYQLVDGDVRVEKIEWRKPVEQELERRRMNDGWVIVSPFPPLFPSLPSFSQLSFLSALVVRDRKDLAGRIMLPGSHAADWLAWSSWLAKRSLMCEYNRTDGLHAFCRL